MSLINEALKKAQRNQTGSGALPPVGGEAGGPVAKRGQPRSAKATALLGLGAVVLILVSVAFTALWFSRTSTPAPAAAKAVVPVAAKPADSAPPTIVVPPLVAVSIPKTVETEKPAEKPAVPPAAAAVAPPVAKSVRPATEPAPAPAEQPARPAGGTNVAATSAATNPESTATPAPVASPVESTPKPPPAPTAKPDTRIQQFVDSVKVMGIRSSGAESKVLMNDRVYRVNDVVDRNLGVRLTKVSTDSLTFTDDNGVTYVKYF